MGRSNWSLNFGGYGLGVFDGFPLCIACKPDHFFKATMLYFLPIYHDIGLKGEN